MSTCLTNNEWHSLWTSPQPNHPQITIQTFSSIRGIKTTFGFLAITCITYYTTVIVVHPSIHVVWKVSMIWTLWLAFYIGHMELAGCNEMSIYTTTPTDLIFCKTNVQLHSFLCHIDMVVTFWPIISPHFIDKSHINLIWIYLNARSNNQWCSCTIHFLCIHHQNNY